MPLLPYLDRIVRRENLPEADAHRAMSIVLAGQATTPRIAAFLVALRMKGETADEVVGFARAMREAASPVDAGAGVGPLLDTCGTGGDGMSHV